MNLPCYHRDKSNSGRLYTSNFVNGYSSPASLVVPRMQLKIYHAETKGIALKAGSRNFPVLKDYSARDEFGSWLRANCNKSSLSGSLVHIVKGG